MRRAGEAMRRFEVVSGRGRWRSPCRRAVDRTSVRADGDYVGKLALGNVKLWKCENLAVWKYGNGLSVLMVAGGNDARRKNTRELYGNAPHTLMQRAANFTIRSSSSVFIASLRFHNSIISHFSKPTCSLATRLGDIFGVVAIGSLWYNTAQKE